MSSEQGEEVEELPVKGSLLRRWIEARVEIRELRERLAAAEYALDRADSAIEWYQQMTKTVGVGKGCEIAAIGARDNIREYKNLVQAAGWLQSTPAAQRQAELHAEHD